MFGFLKKLFGVRPSVDYATLVKEGAQIIDVRTRGEYGTGHIPGSINIPLQELSQNFKKIKKDKVVIACCASGMRSSSAKNILQNQGFTAHNGGSWTSLQSRL